MKRQFHSTLDLFFFKNRLPDASQERRFREIAGECELIGEMGSDVESGFVVGE